MQFSEFQKLLTKSANPASAIKMAAYMKNLFPFLGINSPDRKLLAKEFLQLKLKSKTIDWAFVDQCFAMPEREYQYIALDYLIPLKKHTQQADMDKIEQLIQTKSWWDTVDGLDQVAGAMVIKFPELIDSHIRKWMVADNIWLKRVAIDHQLGFKANTNAVLLSEIILANLGTKEFFINKAIGWSLREYAKTNSAWVRNFIETHKNDMHNLSIREGSKYL